MFSITDVKHVRYSDGEVAIWRNPRNGGRAIIVAGSLALAPADAYSFARSLVNAADKAIADGMAESRRRLQ